MIKKDLIESYFAKSIEFKGIERELKIDIFPNKAITIVGPRRSGKTYYLLYLYNKFENSMYVNFEDIVFRNVEAIEFFDIIKIFTKVKYAPKNLFLDEIQIVNNWESLVRSLIDRGYNVFITGSSSKLLPKEIATQLRGRTLSYLLLPFSFREFLISKNFKKEKYYTFEERGTILKYLEEYLTFGGFPEVVLSENKEKLIREYFDAIFWKDFVERHKIKNIDFGRFLFEFVFQNFSKELSINKIRKHFTKQKISFHTLYDYVNKLTDTLNVFFLNKFSTSVYLRSSWPKKVYVCDIGIPSILLYSKDIGKKMENVVFLDLLRKTNENPLTEIYYFKDYQQNEVDFVIKEGTKVKQLIQVTYASSKDEIEKREIKALLKASNLLK
ncbi:MAG: ATP-binding protein, partial [Candidatus Aenigmatarchaeota archaeon]